jgi:hypothetical protein
MLYYSSFHLMMYLQEEPAVIESYYNKRIVGCPGGEGGKSVVPLAFLLHHQQTDMDGKIGFSFPVCFPVFLLYFQRMNMMLCGSG